MMQLPLTDAARHAARTTLARLLAEETITVVHDPSASTASFDMTHRLLTLPDWQVDETTYSMLLLHEVGHALWTPAALTASIRTLWPDYDPARHKDAVNVFEDIRIDALARRRWAGAPRTYATAWEDLLASPEGHKFTPAADAPLPLRVLAQSRGAVVTIRPDEAADAARMSTPATFADVVALARAWASGGTSSDRGTDAPDAAASTTATDSPATADAPGDPGTDGTPSDAPGDASKDQRAEDGDAPADGQTPTAPDGQTPGAADQPDPSALVDPLADYLQDRLPAGRNAQRTDYLPGLDTRTYVLTAEPREVRTALRDIPASDPLRAGWATHPLRAAAEATWRECEADADTMAAAFRVKVDAAQYAQAGRVTTGRLDLRRLHAYRYTDHLFTTLTTLPKGTSHGLVVAVDLSGSMVDTIRSEERPGPLLQQLVTLALFCRKVRIPYSVVGWTALPGDMPTLAPPTEDQPAVVNIAAVLSVLRTTEFFSHRDTPEQHADALDTLGAWWASLSGHLPYHEAAALGYTPTAEMFLRLPVWARDLGAVDRPLLAVLTDGHPSGPLCWDARTLSDATTTTTYEGAPDALSSDRWDSPLWAALCDRVRTLTGGALLGYYLTDDAYMARSLCTRAGLDQPITPGGYTLGRTHGFDAFSVLLRDRPRLRTAATTGTTRASKMAAVSEALATRAALRPFLTAMGGTLATLVAAPATPTA